MALRNQSIKHTDIIGQIGFSPENAVTEYFDSKTQTTKDSENAPIKEYESDCSKYLFLKYEMEHESMLSLQKQFLCDQKQRQLMNNKRMIKMEKWSMKLKKDLVETNRFIKDYNDKQMKARKILNEQRQIHQKMQSKISNLSARNKELKKFRLKLISTTEEYKPYETIVKEVVANSSRFQTVKDLLNYCDALMLAYFEIEQMEKKKYQELINLRTVFRHINDKAIALVVALMVDLNALTMALHKAKNECSKWEDILENARLHEDVAYFKQERSRDVIHHLYVILCKRQNITPVFQRSQIEEQLDFIKEEFYILQRVVDKCETEIISNPIKQRKSNKIR